MNGYAFLRFSIRAGRAAILALLWLGLCGAGAQAQVTISSMVPPNGATGVSPSAAVVFTFSGAMDTNATTAFFIDISNPTGPLTTIQDWNAAGTVLTCTPSPAFPSNKSLTWAVSGQAADSTPLGGIPTGSFTTGSGGGGTTSGSGTNRITTFNVGKIYSYEQNSAAAPSLMTNVPFAFGASVTLASNRTATAITLTSPSSAVTNLTQNFVQHETYDFFYFTVDSNVLEAAYRKETTVLT